MQRRLVKSCVMAALAAVQIGLPTPSFAQSDAAIEAARRVNIAGRQRMLSQRISKAACFISTGQVAEAGREQMSGAHGEFGINLHALRRGNESLGLGREYSGEIISILEVVESDWQAYSQQLQVALNGGPVLGSALSSIDASGLTVLENMNRAVGKTASVYGDSLPDMPLILSLTIDLAGRQRMFTQKAAKEFCLIDAGVEVEENRARLAQTANFFTLTLGALQTGMPGMVMAAPNDKISSQLAAVAEAWAGPQAALEKAASGAAITDAERSLIVNDMEQVLVLMNQAVGMYEEVIPE